MVDGNKVLGLNLAPFIVSIYAEKQHFWHFSAFLDFGFKNFKENDNFLTILVLVTVKYIKPQYINQFGAMFYSQLFQKLSCGR